MITVEDIVGLTCLTQDEVAALAEHGHIAEMDAALLGEYLMHHHHGPQRVQQMICEDIRAALHGGEAAHARKLYAVLHKFLADHPEAVRGAD